MQISHDMLKTKLNIPFNIYFLILHSKFLRLQFFCPPTLISFLTKDNIFLLLWKLLFFYYKKNNKFCLNYIDPTDMASFQLLLENLSLFFPLSRQYNFRRAMILEIPSRNNR